MSNNTNEESSYIIVTVIAVLIALAVMFIVGYGNGLEAAEKQARDYYEDKLDSIIVNHLDK